MTNEEMRSSVGTNLRGVLDSQGTDKGSKLYSHNINFDLKMKSKKNNFLIGAASTSFTLPVVLSFNNSTMIGFQNARHKLES